MTLIVSEETGYVSVAYMGELYRKLDADEVKAKIAIIQNKPGNEEKKILVWKGRPKG